MLKPLSPTPQIFPRSATPLTPQRSRKLLLSLTTVCLLLVAFAFQGSRPLWEPDEGRYTAVALEMIEHSDYLIPRLNDNQEHFTKPPLTYWMVAASFSLFGHNAWAARLPNALAFVATGLLLLSLGLRFVPQRPWLPVFIWSTSLLTVLGANVANTDTLLALFECLAVVGFVRAWALPPEHRRNPLLLMWLAFALAFLTKGPPGLLPLLAICAFVALTDGWGGVRRLFRVSALLLFCGVGGTWFIWLMIERPDLIDYFLRFELVDRVFSDVHDRNAQWYGAIKIYLPVLLLATLPWCLLDRRWLVTLKRIWRPRFWHDLRVSDPDRAFLLLWLLLPLLVFCVARSRMFLYVLPLMLPIALLCGRALAPIVAPLRDRRWAVALIAWSVSVVLVKEGVAQFQTQKDASALALSIHDLVRQQPIAELFFVGSVPSYGQRLYLGADVEQVTASDVPQWRQGRIRVTPICEALARPRTAGKAGLRLALVTDEVLAQWSGASPGCLVQGPEIVGHTAELTLIAFSDSDGSRDIAIASRQSGANSTVPTWFSALEATLSAKY